MPTEPMVRVRGVSKTFNRDKVPVEALTDIDLELTRGEVVSVVGPSGCGKTTLLRLFAGLLSPSTGELLVSGLAPEENLKHNGLGFVFQRPLLFPWRTVIQNLLLPVELCAGARAQDGPENARRLLSALGLSGFEAAYPHELSGGMLQRAALARALMTQPSLLLLDEPFSALDETTREQIWTDFHVFWKRQGLTVVLVTHSIREAVFLSDRVLTMSRRPGHILAEVTIPFAVDRVHSLTATPDFTELCEEVRERLQ